MAIDLPQIRQRVTVDDSGFDRGFGRIRGKLGSVGKLLGGAVAAGAGAAAAGVGAFVATGVKGAIDVERGLREVVTLFNESGSAADALFDEMQSGLAAVSEELGIAQQELTGGLYQAISKGVPKENAFEFLKIAGQAAIGGVTDVETAVDGLTTTLNAFGLDADRTQDVADSMFMTVAGGGTTFEELSASMFQVAPAAASAGIGFEEVNAGIAALTSMGTPTAQATTQMRQAITELSKPGTQVGEVFEEVAGKSFRAFIEEGGNLQDALGLLQGEAEETGAKVGDYFSSVEAANAATGLAETGADKFASALDDQANAAGAAGRAFETMNESTSRQWEIFTTKLSNAAIAVGSVLLPAINTILSALADRLMPVLEAVGGVIGALADGDVWQLARMFGFSAEAADDATGIIGDRFSNVRDLLAEVMAQIRDTVGGMMEQVRDRMGSILESVTGIVSGALELISTLWALFGDDLLRFVSDTFGAILRIIDGALRMIRGVIDVVVGLLTGDWARAWDGIKGIVSGAWDVIMGVVERAIATVRLIIGAGFDLIRTIVGNVWQGIYDLTTGWMESLRGAIGRGIEGAVAWFRELPGRIRDAVGDLGNLLLDAGRRIIEGLVRGIRERISRVTDAIGDVASTVRRHLPFSPAKEGPLSGRGAPDRAGEQIGEMIAGGLLEARPQVSAAMDRLLTQAAALDAGGIGPRTPTPAAAPTPAAGPHVENTWNIDAVDPAEIADVVGREQRFGMALVPGVNG